ncbi:hypothetical protein LZ554_000615 [Drepanopeziza brunnea f. sp. 'monogermtubi']|nr:hypothetical protein LZ554_000615 [Drepanopeziza brunnea f. sp. 'monogermtubi']
MASKSCSSCLRALQKQSRSISQVWILKNTAPRLFTTTSTRNVEAMPPNTPPNLSIPPVAAVQPEGRSKPTLRDTAARKAAAVIKSSLSKSTTETYTAYGATELLYKDCAQQADYTITQAQNEDEEMPKTEDGEDLGVGEGWWLNEAALKPTFSTWSQVTMLHMYLLSVRLRCFPAQSAQTWQQHLLDHFFYDAENRMTINHNMHARGTRNKYLKDLFVQWRGLLAAYDEGLVKGDAVLAAAIWRNVYKAKEDVDIRVLAQIVSYMRRALKGLDALPDEKINMAALQFGDPKQEAALVRSRSKMMDLPFERAQGKGLPSSKQS